MNLSSLLGRSQDLEILTAYAMRAASQVDLSLLTGAAVSNRCLCRGLHGFELGG